MSKFITIKYVITYLLCLHCPLSDKFFTNFLFSSLFRPCPCMCVCVHILYLNFNPFLMARMAGCAIILFYPFYAVCPLRQQQQHQSQSQPSLSLLLLLALLMPCRQQFLWYICFIAWLFCRVCHVSPLHTHVPSCVCVQALTLALPLPIAFCLHYTVDTMCAASSHSSSTRPSSAQ